MLTLGLNAWAVEPAAWGIGMSDVVDRVGRIAPRRGAQGWVIAALAVALGAACDLALAAVLGPAVPVSALGIALLAPALVCGPVPLAAAVAASCALQAWKLAEGGAGLAAALAGALEWGVMAGLFVTVISLLVEGLRTARATRRAAEAARRLAEQRTREAEALKDELRHRMRNLLSVVGGLASASFASGDQRENLRRFRGRLDAHIRAHDLVFSGERAPVPLRDLVRAVLVAFPTERLDLSGDRALVASDKAPALGLALHELATNAQKHGAWSNGVGRVRLCVEGDGAGGFRYIQWSETGGPPVDPEPARAGFGTKVLKAILIDALKGEVERELRPEGLLWRFHAGEPTVPAKDGAAVLA
ncbi:sensor histidine kinase [Jannaschia sp. Os4]|uniref:sensor histidine kinase n=1 Tax=Jannaschia sp. Os4 TaxID=2807617 RepID=UPI00193A1944|nr:sensor histidine kinase [Jannaschia sp. Os4]MBM2576691.1 sensor histidine kinase [Jannaschia sp. Os4]